MAEGRQAQGGGRRSGQTFLHETPVQLTLLAGQMPGAQGVHAGGRGLGILTAAEEDHEVPLGRRLVGPQTHRVAQAFRPRRGEPIGSPRRKPLTRRHRHHIKIGMRRQKAGHRPLVLLGVEGAGAVEQIAAGAHQAGRMAQNLLLQGRATLHMPGGPGAARRGVLAKHPLSRARGVQQHPVEKGAPTVGQALRLLAQHDDMRRAPAVEVVRHLAGAVGLHIVGNQQPFAAHQRRQMGGLAARGSGQIDHPLAGPGGQNLRRGHGRGLLDVVQPGGMVRVGTRTTACYQTKPSRAPRYRL